MPNEHAEVYIHMHICIIYTLYYITVIVRMICFCFWFLLGIDQSNPVVLNLFHETEKCICNFYQLSTLRWPSHQQLMILPQQNKITKYNKAYLCDIFSPNRTIVCVVVNIGHQKNVWCKHILCNPLAVTQYEWMFLMCNIWNWYIMKLSNQEHQTTRSLLNTPYSETIT